MSDFKRCPGNSPFCLGMTEFDCCGTQNLLDEQGTEASTSDSDFVSPVKKKRLSLSKSKKVLSPSTRFNTTLKVQEIEEQSKGYTPKNTSRSTEWIIRTFQLWLQQRNRHSDEVYPRDILEKKYDAEVLCNCLQRFVGEVRRSDGLPYPPKTLYQMLCGLLRHSRNYQADAAIFLDRKDTRFRKLHNSCDVIFRGLHEEGIGAERKSAQVILPEHEDKLWRKVC